VAGTKSHGHHALRLDGQHPRQPCEAGHRPGRAGLREGHRRVLPLDREELHHDQMVDHVDEEQPEHQHRHGNGDACHRHHRAQRPAREVAQDHARAGVEPGRQTQFDGAPAVAQRRLGPHRFGRRDADRAPHGQPGPQDGSHDGERRRTEQHGAGNPEAEVGKPEDVVVQLAQRATQPLPCGNAEDQPHRADDQRPLDVVPRDGRVAVAERLERRDLAALECQGPRQRDVENEGPDDQEDRRQQPAEALQLLQLVADEPVRELQRAWRGSEPSVRREQAIESSHRRLRPHAGTKTQRDIVERPVQVHGCSERALLHPDDAETRVVRHELAGRDGVDILRGERRPGHGEAVAPAVDERQQAVARREVSGAGESLAHDHLIGAPRLDPRARAQVQIVDAGPPRRGNRDEARIGRALGGISGQDGLRHHPRFDRGHARQSGDGGSHRLRRARQRGKDVAESLLRVVVGLRVAQRGEVRLVHHVDRDAGGDDERHGQRLPPHGPDVAHELAVQHAHPHGVTSSARAPPCARLRAARPTLPARPRAGPRGAPCRQSPRCG
jgi:hypothetical protein